MNNLLFKAGLCLAFITTALFCQAQHALNFDGTTSYVDLGTAAGNNLRSIELWFKPDTTYDSLMTETAALVVRNDPDQSGEFGLYIGASSWVGREGRVVFYLRNSGDTNHVVSNAATWQAGTWYHVAAVVDPSSGMHLYIDGVEQQDAQPAATSATDTRSELTALGCWGDSLFRNFAGTIDEVRFWDRALSESELQNNLCNELNPANQTGLAGYWQLNEGSGAVAADATTNGHDGTNVGASWVGDVACVSNSIVGPELPQAKVWPNPALEIASIQVANQSGNAQTLTIMNALGQQVLQPVMSNSGQFMVSVSDLAPGIYFYEVQNVSVAAATGKLVVR